MKRIIYISVLVILTGGIGLKAQFIEDAIRFSQMNGVYTARAGALGTAFHGISDDAAALAFNPAGLALVNKFEFIMGLGITANSTESKFFDNTTNKNSSSFYFNNIGFISPFGSGKRNATFGLSYFMESNFDNVTVFDGINTNASYINYLANNGPGKIKNTKFEDNPAYHLWLAGNDLKTPIGAGLQQKGYIREKGGLHTITGGFGFELSEFFTVGFSIAGKWGRYNYDYKLDEIDVNNIYDAGDSVYFYDDTLSPPSAVCDLDEFHYKNELTQDIGGVSGTLGFISKIGKHFRTGLSIKLPTLYSIDEEFTEYAEASFDSPREYFDNTNFPNPWEPESGVNSYQIVTPFVYSLGLSFNMFNLTIASAIEYFDATQLEFLNAPSELEKINDQILDVLTGQISWGIGAEYRIPNIPVDIRSSYSIITSPYLNSMEGETISKLGFGLGIYPAPNIRLEAMVQLTDQTLYRQNYGVDLSKYSYKMSPMNIAIQMTYRY